MWRAAPVKAAKISPGHSAQYWSKSGLNGGGFPLAIARAIRRAYSSVGNDLDCGRAIVLLHESVRMLARSRVPVVAWWEKSTHKSTILALLIASPAPVTLSPPGPVGKKSRGEPMSPSLE